MKFQRFIFAAVLAAGALGAAGVAQARSDVSWSIGLASPGVGVVVGNAPAYYQPAPVYYEPAPVYYQPPPVYVQPRPVYYQPAPVVYQQYPVQPAYWVPPGHRRWHHRGWDGERGNGHGWDRDR